jgi:DNA-binding SARP family transcriptional activator/predicted ATPase
MSPTLVITLLGGFSLTYCDRPVPELTGGRSQALLAYLVLHRHTPQPRQRIAFDLWPESSDEQARANLRKELSRLRQVLPNPDTLLRVDSKTLQWRPDGNFSSDAVEFEAIVKAVEQTTDTNAIQTQLEQALALYRGDLLPDFDDEWIVAERERLHQIRLRALVTLINLLEEQQDYPSALTYTQQLLRVDGLNESTYATLMRLHGLKGDRAKALQVYHQCMTMLREELGIDPSANTRKLYEQLLREDEVSEGRSSSDSNGVSPVLSRLSPQRSPLPRSPLVGREPEWVSIQQWASAMLRQERGGNRGNAVMDAESTVFLLAGEPGIGKTRLLEELQTFAQSSHAQILWGRGFAAETMRPYGIWTDALRSAAIAATTNLPPALGFLLPELGQPSSAPPDPSHLFDAVVQLLVQWANQAPLLVVLDDIQWIDEASSALLHYAIRLLRPFPVLFALAARSQELTENAAISRVVQALRREQRLQSLELPALDREQTADLIRHSQTTIAPSLSLAVANQVFIDSGGNPLFALEIARFSAGDAARSLGQNQPSCAHTLEALIGDRLNQLDDTTREILPWAAALGRSFKPSTVAEVAEYSVGKLLTAIAQLEQQAIVRASNALEDEMGYDFAHDIVRQVVYQQISEPRRQLIHRQIARKLQEQAAPDRALASDIAYHAALGGDRALATSAALAAAERCLKLFAYAEALELAQQGIQHCQFLDPPNRILSHASLLRVQALAGVTGDRATQIEHEGQQLIQESKLLGVNEAEVIAIEALIVLQFDRSDFTGVHEQTLRALEASQMTSPAMSARVLAYSGSCLAEIGRDLIRAEALLLEAQSLAERVGVELYDIFSGLGCVHRHYGRYDEARAYLQRSWRLTQAQQEHWRECTYLGYLAMVELETGNPIAALSYCDEISTIAAKIQGEGSEATVAAALAALARYRLEHPNAEKELTEAIAKLQQVDAKRMLAYVLIGAAEVDLNCDRPALAVNRAEAALRNAQIVNHPSEIALSWAVLIQGLFALGEQQQATDQLELLQQAIKPDDLSYLAQFAVEGVVQQMPVGAAPKRKSPK